MGSACYLHVLYSIWVVSVKKEDIYFLYEGMSFPPTSTSRNTPGIIRLLPFYSCFLSTINNYPLSKSWGMSQLWGWVATAVFPIHVSVEITESSRDLDLLLICRQIPMPDWDLLALSLDCSRLEMGWKWQYLVTLLQVPLPKLFVYFMI